MALTVRDILQLDALRNVQVVAGSGGLGRQVRWVHIWPEVLPWFHGGELLLTTGHSWPEGARDQRRIIRELDQARLAAILFATGRFFPSIPRPILAAAERARLPILEAPSDIAFAELTEVINREIIRSQYEVIEQSEQIHKALTASALEAKELADICQVLSGLIRKHVAIEDAEFRLLAEAPWPPEGSPAIGPEARSARVLDVLRRRGALASLGMARGAVRISGLKALGVRNRIACPIRIAGDLVGYLWVLEGEETLTDLDVRAAEHGAVVAALHILRQQSVASVEARVQNSFVQALIQGELDRVAGQEERARLLGFDPEARYVTGLLALLGKAGEGRKRALAGLEEFHLRERLARALRVHLAKLGFPALLGYVMNQVVFLLPVEVPAEVLREKVATLWQRVKASEAHLPCAMGLGGIHPRAAGVAASYAESDSALAASDGEGVFWYEDLLVVRLLRSVGDGRALIDLRTRTLGRLRGAPRGAMLAETLVTLVRHGFNQRAAARAMHAHWNTMRHRIARIETILERPLSDPQLRLQLQLALEAERILPSPAARQSLPGAPLPEFPLSVPGGSRPAEDRSPAADGEAGTSDRAARSGVAHQASARKKP
ncbi:MAG: PucR family transcriptional regulator ligand-binding domain-containing protein [Chloroflexi bacterium]|nr:PucR family transcriptional regulator ligand-binding domain-containing protein [Chloroflexota bacterium]